MNGNKLQSVMCKTLQQWIHIKEFQLTINPLTPIVAIWVQLWASTECPDVKNYKWWLNPVWDRMHYSCAHMATVCAKGLSFHCRVGRTWTQYRFSSIIGRWNARSMLIWTGKVLLKSTSGSVLTAGSAAASGCRFGADTCTSAVLTTSSLSSACHRTCNYNDQISQMEIYVSCVQQLEKCLLQKGKLTSNSNGCIAELILIGHTDPRQLCSLHYLR